MDHWKVVEGIEFAHDPSFRRQEHYVERMFEIRGQFFRQRASFVRQGLHVFFQDPGTHKPIIDLLYDRGFREQTCSQVGAAWSAALVVKVSP